MSKAKLWSKQQRGKHFRNRRRTKVVAAVGVATVTATAVAVSVSPPYAKTANIPVALSASSGPNYTQLIEDSSNRLDDLLLAGTLTDTLNALLNPLGGTLAATTEQNNLLAVDGAVNALVVVLDKLNSLPDVTNVPGLPTGSADVLAQNLDPVLAALAVLLPLADIVDNLTGVPGALDAALDNLEGINTLLTSLLDVPPISTVLALAGIPIPQITIPSVTGLVDDLLESLGATATETVYDSTLTWPVLGINGTSNVTNVFAKIPSLTEDSLVDAVLDGVVIPNLTSLIGPILTAAGLSIPDVLTNLSDLVDSALLPLDLIATPSVTAWIPSANGLYTLPMGGSFGYLATMPTVDIAPLTVGGITLPLNGADTVVATPILAAGLNLPLNLASFGVLTTPGVLFPTATGVSSLGGTTLQSLSVPGLLDWTNQNTLSAVYVGSNGINVNTGQNVGAFTTAFGNLPYEFSLGSFNIGMTGFGYSGSTIAGVNVLPGFQIGTAPVQVSDDGLLPADVINAGLIPIQAADATTTSAEGPASLTSKPPVAQTLSVTRAEHPGETSQITNLETPAETNAPHANLADASIAPKRQRNGFDFRATNAADMDGAAPGTAEPSTPRKIAGLDQVRDDPRLTGDNGSDDIRKPGDSGSEAVGVQKNDNAEADDVAGA
jgi:hypothetical protein